MPDLEKKVLDFGSRKPLANREWLPKGTFSHEFLMKVKVEEAFVPDAIIIQHYKEGVLIETLTKNFKKLKN